MIDLDLEQERLSVATIKVIGVGGAGGNTINSMIDAGGYDGIEFIAANTDAQALRLNKAGTKIQLGVKSTKGLGSGANPELGRRAAEEDIDKVLEAIGEADIVFLSGGMGGGTGSGAIPVIARALKSNGILTLAVVTKPFQFEGRRRAQIAEQAIELLKKEVDTLIVIPNQKLLGVVNPRVSMIDAFAMINDVLNKSVRGISDIITKPGHINVDFADMREIMRGMGLAIMGTGKASGENRAIIAAQQAISSPLLENMSITGAKGVLLNISGSSSLGLHEISEAASIIYEQADQDANIILGSVIDDSLGDEIHVTLIATGFAEREEREKELQKIATAEKAGALEKPVEAKKGPLVDPAVLLDEQPEIVVPKELKQEAKAEPKIEASSTVKQEEELASMNFVDAHDLDVPAFMRKQKSAGE